jgi:KaiC/GvpD/RAD55 family RecA-like ATPase
VREGIEESGNNIDFQMWSVHHGGGRADTDSAALKQKSERRNICFESCVSKGRRRKLKRHAVLASVVEGVVPLSSKGKVEAARRTMVKRKMYQNPESAFAGRIGSRASLKTE